MKIFPVFCLASMLLVLIFPMSGNAQMSRPDSIILKNRLKAEIRLDVGNILPTNDFVKPQNTDPDGAHYFGYSLRLAKQTTGNKLWHQIYGYPEYGIGVYSAVFTNSKLLGNPIAVYGFFNAPFFKINRLSLNYELGLGLTFNWNDLNPVSNPNNVAISTDKSVYIDAGISLKYLLNRRLSFELGYGFTHFSNGRLKMPNKGLNTTASKFGLSYNLNDDPIRYQLQLKPAFSGHYEWIISGYSGSRNVLYVGTNVDLAIQMKGLNYAVFGLSNTFNRQINYKSKIGFGFTMEYNGSQNSQIIVEKGTLDELDQRFERYLALSIYPSYEVSIR